MEEYEDGEWVSYAEAKEVVGKLEKELANFKKKDTIEAIEKVIELLVKMKERIKNDY